MKHLHFIFSSVICFFVLHSVYGAETPPKIVQFDYKDHTIYSIQDQANRMPKTLFKSVDPEYKITMPDSFEASANVFLVRHKKKDFCYLVDAGFGNRKSGLLRGLNVLKISPQKIGAVFITHIHPDHVGGLLTPDGRKAFPAAKVYIARKEYEMWEKDPYRRALKKFLTPYHADLVLFNYDQDRSKSGMIPRCYPGHTPGHTVFELSVQKEAKNGRAVTKKLNFVGDIVHAADLQIPHPVFCARFDIDPKMAYRSRHKLLNVKDTVWLGAHLPFPGVVRIVKKPHAGRGATISPHHKQSSRSATGYVILNR